MLSQKRKTLKKLPLVLACTYKELGTYENSLDKIDFDSAA